jgi:AcrR family transcriptional regulator
LSKEQRKSEILTAATKVFAEKGYRGASVSDINDAAGIARGTFYLYFESKKDVFVELIESYFTEYGRILNDFRQKQESLRDPTGVFTLAILRESSYYIFKFNNENRDLAGIIYREAMGMDEDFHDRFGEMAEQANESLYLGFKSMADLDLLRPCTLEVVTSMVVGSIVFIVMDHIVEAEGPIDLLALADELVDDYARALGRPELDIELAIELSKKLRDKELELAQKA